MEKELIAAKNQSASEVATLKEALAKKEDEESVVLDVDTDTLPSKKP